MSDTTFVGIGFGAIQGGLFLYEAFRSGNFQRLVVAEVIPEVVAAVRRDGGRYQVNIATAGGLVQATVTGIEIFNPSVPADREQLLIAIRDAREIATALPSVDFFERGGEVSAAALLADGLALKNDASPRAVIYTAENHNHAAELLDAALDRRWSPRGDAVRRRIQCLNTVVGKMSGVVTDPVQMAAQNLAPIAPGLTRAFLVEEFNRILITRIRWSDFRRGIEVFIEKDDLLPFEEAKLYGHNATHALLGYLGKYKKCVYMTDAGNISAILAAARAAFIEESGAALCRKHSGGDPLFTAGGYQAYADDLIRRMLNPHLRDTVERITRDPRRKLAWDDRLVGTMRLALNQDLCPRGYALGAAAALHALGAADASESCLENIWRPAGPSPGEAAAVMKLIREALERLRSF